MAELTFDRYLGTYHQSRMFLYRPSPQVPKPSAGAAQICFESASFVISLSKKQIDTGAMDSTWMFLLNLSTALNTLLWSISYPDVRQAHGREEVDELINSGQDALDKCSARWPGAAATSQLYAILSRACMQSYEDGKFNPLFSFTSPSNGTDVASPPLMLQGAEGQQQQVPFLNPPQFGYVFDSPPESMNAYTFDPNFPPPQPAFRSNSIFCNPATDSNGRRFSYFPPDFSQPGEGVFEQPVAPMPGQQHTGSPSEQMSSHLPTPPESLAAPGSLPATTPSSTLTPPPVMAMQTPSMAAMSLATGGAPPHMTPPQKNTIAVQANSAAAAAMPRSSPALPQQKPLPAATVSGSEWFGQLPQFVSPYSIGQMSSSFFSDDALSVNSSSIAFSPTGQQNAASMTGMPTMASPVDNMPPYGFLQGRHGSLSHSQQMELMNVLETEGAGDIDAFLNASNNMVVDGVWY